MKCNTCIYEWVYLPDQSSPYGEYACYKKEIDLYEIKSEDVENCFDYCFDNKSNMKGEII